MIVIAREEKTDPAPSWHKGFLNLLPAIQRHAAIAFRDLNADARAEAIQEVICNAMVAYRRLVELKKADVAYPSVLARFGVAQVRSGRKVGGHLNGNDVLSRYAGIKNRIVVQRLDHYDWKEDAWQQILVEDRHAGPAEVAACRIDFGDWLQTLTSRQRNVARLLAMGESTKKTARNFGLTAGRVSQVRRELKNAWEQFVAS